MAFGSFCVLAVLFGWLYRNQIYLKAEKGLGYALGIVGCACMITLLVYPARKKLKFMRSWGPLKPWFTFHMFLGLVGPIIILFHANFRLGSTNSNVAMFAMLLIVASGLVGRYLYRHINIDLLKHRRSMQALQEKINSYREQLGGSFLAIDHGGAVLHRFENGLSKQSSSLSEMTYILFFLPIHSRWVRFRILYNASRDLSALKKRAGWSNAELQNTQNRVRRTLKNYLLAIMLEGQLKVFKRLFSWWHVIHMPLFFIAVLAAVFHVIAVHIY